MNFDDALFQLKDMRVNSNHIDGYTISGAPILNDKYIELLRVACKINPHQRPIGEFLGGQCDHNANT